MGPFRAGRFQQFTISRQRTRQHSTTDEANEHTPTSGRFGYDTPSQTLSDWERLGLDYDGDLDEAGE
jgi:hypothetical protein